MDDDAFIPAFRAHTEGQTKFTRRMAILMAGTFDMTPRQMVLRLERMNLLRRGSWDWFVDNGGITEEQIDEVRAALDQGKDGA